MKTKVDTNEIKQMFPKEHAKIVKSMAKKGVAEEDIDWKFTWCVRIGHLDCRDPKPYQKPDTLEEFVENIKETYGVALEGQNGRKYNGEPVDIKTNLPSYFLEVAKNQHAEHQRKTSKAKAKASNLGSVLESVGKKGSATSSNTFDHATGQGFAFGEVLNALWNTERPEFPTIEDIKSARPDVHDAYAAKADGTKLVVFNPRAGDCDEWGFNLMDVEMATRRDGQDRIILADGFAYAIEGEAAVWMGSLAKLDKARAAKEGEEFRGWRNTKQYRLTSAEIEGLIKGKIFKFVF